MRINFKKTLLMGTALVAVGGFAPLSAQAAVVAQTLTGSVTWAEDANQNQSPADGTGAAASDTVNLATFTLTVSNDQTANDGGGLNAFTLGAVTGTTGSLLISSDVTGATGAVPDLAVTGTSVAISGAGNISVVNQDTDDEGVSASFSGNVSTGGALAVTNTETTTADDVSLSVGGTLAVTGTTGISAGAFAGATANATVTGNATFTGAVTLTGGAGAGSNATLTLNGATNAFTGGLTLVTASKSILTLSGSTAQTVSGNITGAGSIVVDNASGATFSGTIGAGAGAITIEKTAGNSSATFKNTVNVSSVTLGAAGTGTNTATFDISANDFTVTGTVDGAIAGETNNVVVSGGDGTLTQATAWGGVTGTIDNLTVSGSGTILDSNAAITAGATTIGSGATLDVGAGALTSAVSVGGTLLLSGAGGVTGNVNGSSAGHGTLSVTGNAAVTGNIGTTTSLQAINVATTKTLSATGDVKATTTTLTGTGTLALTTGTSHAVATNIAAAVDGDGAITIADVNTAVTTITGDIGSSSKKIATLTVTDGANTTTTTTGDLYVNAISLGANDTLQFLGTSAQTVSGTIAGAGAGKGILSVGNGTTTTDVTFDGIIGGTTLASATVAANATAHLNANTTLAGALTNNGTTEVAIGKTLTANGGFSGTGTYVIDIEDANASGTLTAADFGSLASTGAIDLGAETVRFNFTGETATGANVVLGTGGAGATTAATVTDNSFLYDAALAVNGNNLELTVTREAMENASGTVNGQRVGTTLDGLVGTTDTALAAIEDQIAQAGSQHELDEVLESTTPTVDAGAFVASLTVGDQTVGLTETRLASLRSGDAMTGMAAGNMGRGMKVWGQGFGQTADQDRRDGVDGYNSDTYGAAFGLDTENLSDAAVVGVAFNYANTDVDSDNANNTQTDVDSYGITLYGDYDFGNQTFLSGQVGYAYSSIDQTRYDIGGISGLNADSDYDSNQLNAKIKVGRGFATEAGMTLTPSVSAAYTNVSVDDYTETGAGGANLRVDNDSLNILDLGVGLDASWMHQNSDGSYVKPVLKAGYRYDVIGDNVETTSSFTGGGAAFKTEGFDPARSKFNAGAGLTYYTTTNWELSANYDFEVKADYAAHSGFLRAGYKF